MLFLIFALERLEQRMKTDQIADRDALRRPVG
jgi:hypothetical protein